MLFGKTVKITQIITYLGTTSFILNFADYFPIFNQSTLPWVQSPYPIVLYALIIYR